MKTKSDTRPSKKEYKKMWKIASKMQGNVSSNLPSRAQLENTKPKVQNVQTKVTNTKPKEQNAIIK